MIRDDILRAMTGQPWAIDRRVLDALILAGSTEDLRAAAASRRRSLATSGAVDSYIIPIVGPITRRPSWFSDLFGGTSTAEAGVHLAAALADKSIGRIVLYVDSPGGTVDGTAELAAAVRAGRERKPIISVVEGWAASAALFIATQATAVVASMSSELGSIGVWTMHTDITGALGKAGIVRTFIAAPFPEKVEMAPELKLSAAALKYEQGGIDRLYFEFVEAVALGRGVSRAHVREHFGGGRMMGARQAVTVGLADRLGSLDDVLSAPPFEYERERRAFAGIRPSTFAIERSQRRRAAGATPYERERARRLAGRR